MLTNNVDPQKGGETNFTSCMKGLSSLCNDDLNDLRLCFWSIFSNPQIAKNRIFSKKVLKSSFLQFVDFGSLQSKKDEKQSWRA